MGPVKNFEIVNVQETNKKKIQILGFLGVLYIQKRGKTKTVYLVH